LFGQGKVSEEYFNFLSDIEAELRYANGYFVGEKSEPLVCMLETEWFKNQPDYVYVSCRPTDEAT
jgi:hypothetical protein